MPLLVRRIAKSKWKEPFVADKNGYIDVPADAITNCLKTTDNNLSVWKIESEEDLDDAILALITGEKQESLKKFHYVWIEEKHLLAKGLSLVASDGDTAVNDLIKKHRDISGLTYTKLDAVKDLIVDCIKNNKCHLCTVRQMKTLIEKSIQSGRLQREDLNKKLVEKEKL
ncbi:MAG: hypothetical protein MdMp024_0457 [Bacteroidales bacterium]